MPGCVGLLRWDHSTKGSEHSNVTDPLSLAELNRDTGADGFNGGAPDPPDPPPSPSR